VPDEIQLNNGYCYPVAAMGTNNNGVGLPFSNANLYIACLAGILVFVKGNWQLNMAEVIRLI
jgi:hypothetical protein